MTLFAVRLGSLVALSSWEIGPEMSQYWPSANKCFWIGLFLPVFQKEQKREDLVNNLLGWKFNDSESEIKARGGRLHSAAQRFREEITLQSDKRRPSPASTRETPEVVIQQQNERTLQ